MEWQTLLFFILFLFALLFGFLAWLAKHRWRDRRATRIFVVIAIACTLGVMGIVLAI